MVKIILASGSPRRKQLLSQILGNNFEVVVGDYEEDNSRKISPRDLVVDQAIGKAKSVYRKVNSGLIISADTFVVYDNKVLGKPVDSVDAIDMLNLISGKEILVYTGLCILDVVSGKLESDCVITKVKMAPYSKDVAMAYVATGEPLDKAGSFAIQGKGAVLVEKIDGCYFNVMGFPLYTLSKMLSTFGITVF
ncbi:septum formation protein Maf [Candidatus Woesearchaeota archaeon]|nr:septum formation protein Maf [Candidatus Woesearchaeota archaeon]